MKNNFLRSISLLLCCLIFLNGCSIHGNSDNDDSRSRDKDRKAGGVSENEEATAEVYEIKREIEALYAEADRIDPSPF